MCQARRVRGVGTGARRIATTVLALLATLVAVVVPVGAWPGAGPTGSAAAAGPPPPATGGGPASPPPVGPTAAATAPYTVELGRPVTVRVRGSLLVNGSGQTVRLAGVDHMGTEYSCVQGRGIFDGPVDAAAIATMRSWGANVVRVPLNEDCWLGINGAPSNSAGGPYRAAVVGYVTRLHDAGMAAILELHWNAPGATLATGQQPMADADHGPDFWSSVATSFRFDPGVLFDLYNEPHGTTWDCWLSGCTSPGWATAGMAQLVSAVRSTGSRAALLLGGLDYSSSLGGPGEGGGDPSAGWAAHLPADPAHQLVASVHLYDTAGCATVACWDATFAPVAATHPVVAGEVGEFDCRATFVTAWLDWAGTHGASTLGWTWNAYPATTSCGSANPNVITSYDGTASVWGAALRARFSDQAATHPATAAPRSGGAISASPPPRPTVAPSGRGRLVVVATFVAVAAVAVVVMRRRRRQPPH